MSRSNPAFYTGPDLGLPDADDFLHNPSTTNSAIQVPGEDSELTNADSKGTFLLDWNLHYDEHDSSAVQENLGDSSLFSDLMVDFGNTSGGLATSSFPSDTLLELNSPGMEIFSSTEELLSPKRNSKLLPQFSGPAQINASKASTAANKEAKGNSVLDCICNQPQVNRFILVCDKCDKWFHCECVGISQEQGEEMSRERHIWLCPVCNESAVTPNKSQSNKQKEVRSHIATRSQNKLEAKVPVLKISKKLLPTKEGKRCYLKSCQKRMSNQNHHFCSNACIEVTVSNLKSFYQIKGLPSADSERVTLLDKSNMKILTGVSAPTLGGLAAWLKAHSTHVPIKPQPRPQEAIPSIKTESKMETPVSNHEEIVRGKARKQLTDILLSRVESAPDYAKYADSIPKVANQIEAQLYALDRNISTRYKNRYRSLSFSLRDSKNVGLYQRVVSGETPPEKLVQLSTEQLAPEDANSAKEAKNSSNSDIPTTRSKTLDKQQSSVDYSSGEITRKNTNNQQKSQNPPKHVSEDKNKQGTYETKKSKSHTTKSNEITPLMTTDVDIPPPKFSPTLSDSDEPSEVDKVVWRGSISMPNLAKCVTNGYLAYGPFIHEIDKILPSNVQVHGRIVYSMVWDYLKKIISSTTKGLVVLRLVPQSGEEEVSFTTLFNYFHKRQRCGVAGGCTATVRDLYLLPFTKGDSVPSLLSALQGPGIHSFKSDTLLAMIVTNKPNDSPLSTVAVKSSEREADSRNNDQKPNSTKQDYTSSLTNPSAPLPFSSIHSKTDLPFSSNTTKTSPDLTAVSASDNFASKPFNPSGLYKPITETVAPKKESYMIPYDKAESETSFNFGLGSKSTGDHIFPGLGEILKKSMDDPIIEDALSNLHFKKPIKEIQITTENTQKFQADFGVQFQDQFGYNNPHSSYAGFPGTERQGDSSFKDLQDGRPHPQTQRGYYAPNSDPNQNLDQFNQNQNYPYYSQEPINQSEHQLQQGQHVPGQIAPQAYPHQEAQGYPNAPAEYWQQFARDSQDKQKQHEMPNQQNQPSHPAGYEGYSHHQWQTTQVHHGHEDPQERQPAFNQEPHHYPQNPNEQYPHHVQKHGSFPPTHVSAEQAQPEHRHPYHPQLQETAQQQYTELRQQEQDFRRPVHEYANQTHHLSEYQREQYPGRQQTGRYFDRPFADNELEPNRAEESEKNRELYSHQHEANEEGREWRPPFEQLREDEKWQGSDRRSFEKKNEKGLVEREYRQEREEKEREQGLLSWDLERARRDFRLDAELLEQTRLEDRALPPFLRRRLPLRTALTHHLDLARREVSFRGRGSPFGIGVRPSLLERDRIRLKREFPQEKEMLGAPLKLYRAIESPPKPSFEPIARQRPTMRVRKRDRMRKSPKLRPRDANEGVFPKREDERLGKDEPESLGPKKIERRSRRRSRYSRNKDFDKTDETTAKQSEQTDKSPEKLLLQGDIPLQSEPVQTAEELYPQVVQEAIGNNEFVRKESLAQPEMESKGIPQSSEEDNLSKFPPKHLQREKLLAMQEKLQNSIVPPSSPSVNTRAQEKSERTPKRRSRTRSREREHKGGRRRRSRSRERNRRAHSRDEISKEKETVSILSRERLLRERDELPRRDTQAALRERQLIALERERELLRVRARLALPGPAAIDAIRERSPLRIPDIDPRRPFVSPFIRARALEELRRGRIDRGVPGVFRGQYLYQSPRQ